MCLIGNVCIVPSLSAYCRRGGAAVSAKTFLTKSGGLDNGTRSVRRTQSSGSAHVATLPQRRRAILLLSVLLSLTVQLSLWISAASCCDSKPTRKQSSSLAPTSLTSVRLQRPHSSLIATTAGGVPPCTCKDATSLTTHKDLRAGECGPRLH